MLPATPPVADLNRARLRQLASWIRDELDPIIAQEGPEKLRADDVLMLHEAFQALRHSLAITALDLRATGIHRAVLDVAGTATRWPGRLVDDCDRIILIWQSKFGRLEDLRPFMYGRGGRLEGIARAGEFSSAALLKRWQSTSREQIAPKRSRREGNLGFTAGDWWINPLFAHYAGIIDVESSEGGICFDKDGAYALVLKDTGEIDAPKHSSFTYRCARGDKGKFRLTSATEKTRRPIRVLRCHNLNSIWGPKAGIRYEGLYHVRGWTIRTAKSDDAIGKAYNVGDILYEVMFERDDPIPSEEVLKHPNAAELDDYSEYKRLRRAHRDEHHLRILEHSDSHEHQVPTKLAPPIAPSNTVISHLRAPNRPANISRTPTATFKDPVATIVSKEPSFSATTPKHLQSRTTGPFVAAAKHSTDSTVTPTTDLGPRSFPDVSKSTPGVALSTMAKPAYLRSASESPLADSSFNAQQWEPTLISSSSRSGEGSQPPSRESQDNQRIHHSDITHVVPWINYDLELVAAAPSIAPRLNREHATRSPAPEPLTRSATRKDSSGRIIRSESDPLESSTPHEPKKKAIISKKQKPALKELKKEISSNGIRASSRSKNPLAKLFDGTEDHGGAKGNGNDYFSSKPVRHASCSVRPSSPMVQRHTRSSSSDGATQPLSPVPIRPLIPLSGDLFSRRGGTSFPSALNMTDSPSATDLHEGMDQLIDDGSFVDRSQTAKRIALPQTSLKSFISAARTLTPVKVSIDVSTPASGSFSPAVALRSSNDHNTFKDPFQQTRETKTVSRKDSSNDVEGLSPGVAFVNTR